MVIGPATKVILEKGATVVAEKVVVGSTTSQLATATGIKVGVGTVVIVGTEVMTSLNFASSAEERGKHEELLSRRCEDLKMPAAAAYHTRDT